MLNSFERWNAVVKPAGLVICWEIWLVKEGIPTLGFVAGTAMSWLAFLWAAMFMAGVLAVGSQACRLADLLLNALMTLQEGKCRGFYLIWLLCQADGGLD